MKFISPTLKKQIVFSSKLLVLAVVLGAFISTFAVMVIYNLADKLTNAYTSEYTQSFR